MTVLELKQLLADAPDDMDVMVAVEDMLHPGMFAFAPACTCETGVSQLGSGEEGEEEISAFLILPHGFGVTEEDAENGEIPELN